MQSQASHQSRESGAIVGFIVVLLVLLGLMAGGFWFIKNRHDVAANTQTATNEVKEDNKKPAEDNKPANSDNKPQDGNTEPQGEPATPKPDTSTQDNNPPTPPASNNPAPVVTPETPSPSTVAHTGPSHIASTGPEDVLGNAFLLSSLVIVGHIYRQSRRHSS